MSFLFHDRLSNRTHHINPSILCQIEPESFIQYNQVTITQAHGFLVLSYPEVVHSLLDIIDKT